MIHYTHEDGYGNVDMKEANEVIRSLPIDYPGRQVLIELLYDYECLRRVIEGNGFAFCHPDGSVTRKIKLY